MCIFPWIKLSWHLYSMWDKHGSIDSDNLSVRNSLLLIWKDSVTNIQGLLFMQDFSLKNSVDSDLRFWLALLHSDSVSYLFSSINPLFHLYAVFKVTSSNIDEVLSNNLSANVFVSGDFNIHHKDWLIYSGRTDRLGELCYIFSISNNLTQMVNFSTWISNCDSHGPAFLDLLLSSDTSICSTMAFLHWEVLIMSLPQLSLTNSILFQAHKFNPIANEYFCNDWDHFHDHLIIKLSVSATASEYCE